jgi:hypothetical protein
MTCCHLASSSSAGIIPVFLSGWGDPAEFKKAEVQTDLIMIALRDNGVPLPRAHGFPARVVAEGVYGGRWVKYLTSITLE